MTILFFFFLQEHYNFSATDEKLGPILLSAKAETVAGHEHWRLVLRLKTGTSHELVPVSCLNLSNGSSVSGPNVNNGNSVSTPCPARMAKVSFQNFQWNFCILVSFSLFSALHIPIHP
jgi:RAP1 GTPase activating protein 1